jgi:hypothetical protein
MMGRTLAGHAGIVDTRRRGLSTTHILGALAAIVVSLVVWGIADEITWLQYRVDRHCVMLQELPADSSPSLLVQTWQCDGNEVVTRTVTAQDR